MHYTRCLLASLYLVFAAVSSAEPSRRSATILPEIKKHLAAAHKYAADGSWDYANANADVVLISDNVSVSVNVERVAAPQRETCMKALQASLGQWQSSLEDTIHFRIESDPAKADIRITFRPDVRMGREAVAGLTNWTRSIRASDGHVTEVSFKADMQVRVRDLEFHAMSLEAMRQETEHEFGHVLGLDDSDHLGDLMGEFDAAHLVAGPRDYEVQAVKALREEARHIKSEALGK